MRCEGNVAEWLRRGLQILVSQFDSGRCLQKYLLFACTFFYKIFEFNPDKVMTMYLGLKAQTEGFKKKDSFLNFFYFYFSYRQSDISL